MERRAPLRPHGSFETSTSKENSAFLSLKSLYVSPSSSRYVREPMFLDDGPCVTKLRRRSAPCAITP